MAGECDLDCKPIAVVARGAEPAVQVSVDDHDFVAVARDDSDHVLGGQARPRIGIQVQAHAQIVRIPLPRRTFRDGSQKTAVGPPEVETDLTAPAEVPNVHIARLIDVVEYGHCSQLPSGHGQYFRIPAGNRYF